MDQAKLDEMEAVTGSYEALEGSVGVLPLANSEYPGTPAFIEKYKEEHDEVPGSEAGYHYVALNILMEAMKAAGSVDDPKAIRSHIQDGLDALPEEKEVYTIEEVGEDGGFATDLSIAAVENGEIVTIEVND